MSTCVCGHEDTDHVAQQLSVPLPVNPKPLYEIPNSMYNNISVTSQNSPYEFDLCHCGCTMFTEDTESESP